MDAVLIPLGGSRGAGLNAIIDASDFDLVSKYRWHLGAGGYVRTHHSDFWPREGVQIHVLILGITAGFGDHRNGDKLDNRRENLRLATRSQNNANRRGWSSTGYKGVKQQGRRFVARLQANGVSIHIGSFGTAEDAARAHDRVAFEKFGEFARLNFPNESQLFDCLTK